MLNTDKQGDTNTDQINATDGYPNKRSKLETNKNSSINSLVDFHSSRIRYTSLLVTLAALPLGISVSLPIRISAALPLGISAALQPVYGDTKANFYGFHD